ncbi:MAG: hypothetical protein HRT57_06295 [Crocinitomicaceae bacterium]|nr:hypothetical protein [Crocinitomicaceae bacterium]
MLRVQNKTKTANNKKIANEKVKARETLIWIFGFVLILVGFGLHYLKKKNNLVKEKNLLVNKQNAEIQIQHKEITDSILYAE